MISLDMLTGAPISSATRPFRLVLGMLIAAFGAGIAIAALV